MTDQKARETNAYAVACPPDFDCWNAWRNTAVAMIGLKGI